VKVAPVAGNPLVWNNLDAIGEYIVTEWHRGRPWRPTDMPTY